MPVKSPNCFLDEVTQPSDRQLSETKTYLILFYAQAIIGHGLYHRSKLSAVQRLAETGVDGKQHGGKDQTGHYPCDSFIHHLLSFRSKIKQTQLTSSE